MPRARRSRTKRGGSGRRGRAGRGETGAGRSDPRAEDSCCRSPETEHSTLVPTISSKVPAKERLSETTRPTQRAVYLSNPKPGHTTGGSGRGCAHGGAAGRAGPGRKGRQRVGSPRREPSLWPFGESKTNVVDVIFGSTNKGNPM